MRVVQINAVARGSTGNIMINIAQTVRENGAEAFTFSAPKKECPPVNHRYFGTTSENMLHRIISVFSGISGKASIIGTRQLLRQLDEIKPDILHLHNLHGWYINLPMLFEYIKHNHIKTVWTLHDCWSFTAQCSHFTMEKCEKWKTGCYNCPRYRIYPYTFVDRTKKMWHLKKQWFSGVDNLTIVTPSQWLADLVKQSYLGSYPVRVINNGINLDIFCPKESNFRQKYGLENKKIILGVASGWTDRKGLDVFIALSKRLPEGYKIVLVGTNDTLDKQLPSQILSIHRTQNQQELAEIYTAADVLVNPTKEENFPTVNIEALACGTPVATFCTGGSPEIIDSLTGITVQHEDIDSMELAIKNICENAPFFKEDCRNRACNFDAKNKFCEYYALYNEILA